MKDEMVFMRSEVQDARDGLIDIRALIEYALDQCNNGDAANAAQTLERAKIRAHEVDI